MNCYWASQRDHPGKIGATIRSKHFPEEDHDNLDWKKNSKLEPFPANRIKGRDAKYITPVKVKKRPKYKFNIADLSVFQWYMCPDRRCDFMTKDSYIFEEHMKTEHEHDCYKEKKIKLDRSGDKTMFNNSQIQKSAETLFVPLPENVKQDYENHKLLQITENLDVSPQYNVKMDLLLTSLANDYVYVELIDGNKKFDYNVDCDILEKTENCKFSMMQTKLKLSDKGNDF